MKIHTINLIFATILTLRCDAKIMRNNALITKMMSNFQKDNNLSAEPETDKKNPENILSLMQNVLCRNFPSIPCDMIMNDRTLNNLIERSIQQINYKKLSMERTTQPPSPTLFPIINSEELSNFLKVRDSGVFNKQKKKHKKVKIITEIDRKPLEYTKKIKRKESKRTAVYNGRKKLRKFYPHKVKFKDKGRDTKDFDYTEEKLSMSVEVPDAPLSGKRQHFSYKVTPDSVWRIDYTKHGEPSLNVVTYDERLRGKTGPSVIVDEVIEQSARKDVLHPDVYIKKNYVKKNLVDLHSDGID
ncbi:uncharacterized protein [Epargyreus clarus]|uniref:uncharacterized protein n=1 Tax=Epargyreus clarus TaxID=520877 RepID=UPI003C2FEAE0